MSYNIVPDIEHAAKKYGGKILSYNEYDHNSHVQSCTCENANGHVMTISQSCQIEDFFNPAIGCVRVAAHLNAPDSVGFITVRQFDTDEQVIEKVEKYLKDLRQEKECFGYAKQVAVVE